MSAMPRPAAIRSPHDEILDKLLVRTGIDGVYARSGRYESVVDALSTLISRHRPSDTEIVRFPPVMSRSELAKSGYLSSFPHFIGCVSCLSGSEAEVNSAVGCYEEGGEWAATAAPTDLVLSPAACYPVYPLAARRGPVPAGGLVFDVQSDCFRREPSKSLDRLQSFRMREYVRIGSPEQVAEFRERWIGRARAIADELGLPHRIEQASDPFFGRGGKLMAMSQLEQALKFELLVPIYSEEKATACMSFNYHRDHFGTTWDLVDASGVPRHTGCVAFGMDRLALAMFWTHGIDPAAWPRSVRATLSLSG